MRDSTEGARKILLLLLSALALPQQKNSDAAQFQALVGRYERAGWSGSALVARGEHLLFARGFGPADLLGERANTDTGLFEIASLSKQFTAAAILKLEMQSKLALDDAIGLHLPEVPAHSASITVSQLLHHTSGVPREHSAGKGEDLAVALKAYLGSGPTHKPGSQFGYWNGGYALLAGIVERASGMGFKRCTPFGEPGSERVGLRFGQAMGDELAVGVEIGGGEHTGEDRSVESEVARRGEVG
jgi:CubicO group peptidase (beta-lactamase class C family)